VGKFEKKEKISSKLRRVMLKGLGDLMFLFIGMVVMNLLDLDKRLEMLPPGRLETDVLYCIGLVIFVAIGEVIAAVFSAIRRKKKQTPNPASS
jgi:hypothetical protein